MKSKIQNYAEAFADLAVTVTPEQHASLVQRFLRCVELRNDRALLPAIAERIDVVLRQRRGEQKVLVESARPLTEHQRARVRACFAASDRIIEKHDKDLIAGIKITMNDVLQLDGSLRRKLQKLFQ